MTLDNAAKNYLLVPLRKVVDAGLAYEVDFGLLKHCSKSVEERAKEGGTARSIIEGGNLDRIGQYLFYT